MKIKTRAIIIRNFLIVVLSFIIAVVSVEILLCLFEKEEIKFAEDDILKVMSYEKYPPEFLFTVAESEKYVEKQKDVVSGVVPARYPLIENLYSTAEYDEDTAEILVLGDSFTFGEAAANRNVLYWRQAERIMRGMGYNVRFSAVAMAGATAYEELQWLQNCLAALKPDIVLFGYVYNDGLIVGDDYGRKERMDISWLEGLSKILPNISERLYSYIETKTIYSKKYGDVFARSNTAVLDGEKYDYYQNNFALKLDALAKENGFKAIVMPLPNEVNSLQLKELYKPLKTVFAETDVSYYDPLPQFNKKMADKIHRNNLHVNPVNAHPGNAAHRFYAEYICDFLINDFPEEIGPKKDADLNSDIIALNDMTPWDIGFKKIISGNEKTVTSFTYPDIKSTHDYLFFELIPYCLKAPLNKDYVKLSFENPVEISELSLMGAEYAELYYTCLNPETDYDDEVLHPMLLSEKTPGVWSVEDGKMITSICIHAEFAENGSRELELSITGKVCS